MGAASAYGEAYPITKKLIEDGRNHLLLGSAIEIGCPVRILQGAKDEDVRGAMLSRSPIGCPATIA